MQRVPGLLAFLAFTAVSPSCTSAQEDPCIHRTLPVDIRDSKWSSIAGLDPHDFEAKFRRKPVKILSIAGDHRPHRIVILVDACGSMQTTWAQALAPAFHLVETPLPNTRMAMLIFREQIIEHFDFAAGQLKIAERLRQIRMDEPFRSKSGHMRTALFDALLAGVKLLDNPNSADILYLVERRGRKCQPYTPG